MTEKITWYWMNWKGRKELADGDIFRFHWLPEFEFHHHQVKSGHDPVYYPEYVLYILWGWGGLMIEIVHER